VDVTKEVGVPDKVLEGVVVPDNVDVEVFVAVVEDVPVGVTVFVIVGVIEDVTLGVLEGVEV